MTDYVRTLIDASEDLIKQKLRIIEIRYRLEYHSVHYRVRTPMGLRVLVYGPEEVVQDLLMELDKTDCRITRPSR